LWIRLEIDLEQMRFQGDPNGVQHVDDTHPTSTSSTATTAVAATSQSVEGVVVGENEIGRYGRHLTSKELERLNDEQKGQFAALQRAAEELWSNGGIDLSHSPSASSLPSSSSSSSSSCCHVSCHVIVVLVLLLMLYVELYACRCFCCCSRSR
jgi:cobalamin biosynthesis Mg chelatase CobN